MKTLAEDIKNKTFKSLYLLYGEEAFLRRRYLRRLKDALIAEGDEINYHCFDGNDTSVSKIIEIAETMPFFAEHRLIVWENSALFKAKAGRGEPGAEEKEKILAYLAKIPETTILVFVEQEVDKRGKCFKFIAKANGAIEFPIQDETALKHWVGGILKEEGIGIEGKVCEYFLGQTGQDMSTIRLELDKLISFCHGRSAVTRADIDAVCVSKVDNRIFEMISCVAEKKRAKAFNLYSDLVTLKEPSMRILFLLGREFGKLLQVKELKALGYDNKRISEKAGLPIFVVGKYTGVAARFGRDELKKALASCAAADEAIKSGNLSDRLSVELLIVESLGTAAK